MFTPRPPSSSGGNATVPDDAPIQPPQAFVDNIEKFSAYLNGQVPALVNCSNSGITFISHDLALQWFKAAGNTSSGFLNLSGNSLSSSNVNDLLEALGNNSGVIGGNLAQIDISGGTNGEPSILDDHLFQLFNDNFLVGFNLHDLSVSLGRLNYDLSGNALTQVEVDGVINKFAFSGRSNSVLDLSGGTNAEPTDGADNADIATLVAAGWTVSVNIGGVPTTFAP